MRIGLILSIGVHLLVLALLLISFPAPQINDTNETVEIPIKLAPLSDQTAVQEGEKQPTKSDKPSPKPTEKPEVKPEAENVGDQNIDTQMPLKPKEKPREVKAAPPVKGEDEGKADSSTENKSSDNNTQQQEKVQEVPSQSKPADDPIQNPAEDKAVEPVEDKTNAPSSSSQESSDSADDIANILDSKTDEAIKPSPSKEDNSSNKTDSNHSSKNETVDQKTQPEKAPVPAPEPKQKPKPPKEESSATARGEKEGVKADHSKNALIDRTRTQGGGAKRSQGEAGQGAKKTVGVDSKLQEALNNRIGTCVSRNWDIGAIQGSAAYDLRVQLSFSLHKDGNLDGEPKLKPTGGDAKDRDVIAIQALAALKKCTPFKLPLDHYDAWHEVILNLKAFPD